MRVSLVPSEAVRHVWKDVESILKKSVATVKDKAEMIDVLSGVLNGTYVLWVVMDEEDSIIAAFTTRKAPSVKLTYLSTLTRTFAGCCRVLKIRHSLIRMILVALFTTTIRT